jgi:hypothetical protein
LNDGVVVLTPSLTVTPETIEVNAEACTAVIEYTVSNSVDGVEATATPSANWITITNGSNSFNLNIAENNDSATREAKITVSYEGAVSKTVVVKQAGAIAEGSVVILHEEFDNATNADSSTAITTSKFPNFNGATSKAYTSKYGGLKLGSSSAVGYITSKALDLSKPFIVEIDACKYGSDGGNIDITVGGVKKSIANNVLGAAGTFKTFTLEFDAATETSTIKIATSAKRAYIDNVKVYYKDSGESGGGESGGDEPETPAEPVQLATPVVTPSVNANVVTLSWNAVAGAGHYTVQVDDDVEKTVTDTKYEFEGDYGVEYKFTVKAIATDTTKYVDSEACVITATTQEEGVTVEKFVKVTSAPSDWSGTYLIVYEDGNLAFDGSRSTLDAVSNTKSVTISNGEIEATDAMKAITFTIAKNGSNYYTIKSASGQYIGNDSNSNALKAETSVLNNTIAFVSANDITIKGKGGSYLRYNAASNQNRFRYYKSSSYTGQKAIQLYKLSN